MMIGQRSDRERAGKYICREVKKYREGSVNLRLTLNSEPDEHDKLNFFTRDNKIFYLGLSLNFFTVLPGPVPNMSLIFPTAPKAYALKLLLLHYKCRL